ncbi:MAG TPA: glycosyltransferase family 2 protein [Fibrella sp.]
MPLLSIVLVSYNSLADLQRCLPSIATQTGVHPADIEIILVDNHHHDGVAEWLPSAWPNVILLTNPSNTGYAGGNNMGLTRATGQWVLFLNPDTVLAPDCLHYILATAQQNVTAFLNPKLLNPDGSINACGNQFHYTGITTCRGLNRPSSEYTTIEPVSLLSGAALMAPAAAVRQLGGFDERYFMYFEDADLSLRARQAGYQLLCDARAEITHYYRLGMSPQKFFYLERNRLLTFRKVLQTNTWRQLLPGLLLTELLTWAFALRGLPYLQARVRTYTWLWQHRHTTQSPNSVLSDATLLADATTALPIEQLMPGQLGALINLPLTRLYRWLAPKWLKK